jgi:Tfp pilus assembly protein PilF
VPPTLTRSLFLGSVVAALALVLAAPAALRADDDAPQSSGNQAPSLSDAVGDALGKLRPLIDAKDWVGAQKMIDDLIPTVQPDSYDLSVLLDTKARVMIQNNDYTGSLPPMEEALAISDRHHFSDATKTMEDLSLLSQLYYQAAGNAKAPKEDQLAAYAKAIQYIERWFKLSTKPSEENTVYYASVLYNYALAMNGEHPDPALVQKTQDVVERGLHISVHPRDNLYVLLLATLQQQGKNADAADVLEAVLQQNPQNKSFWPELVSFYVNLAQSNDKDKDLFQKYYVRAINALERAQALGFMDTPKDHYLLFTFYYDTGQYGAAADLLYNGLHSGVIESTITNWELLSTSYQQISQEFKAVDILKEAAEKFPENGNLDFQIGQIYLGQDKNQDAYTYCKLAADTGHLDKPWVVYNTLSYLAFELGKLDEAKAAIDKAIELRSSEIDPATHENRKPDRQSVGLRNAIDDAIKERDAMNAKPNLQ